MRNIADKWKEYPSQTPTSSGLKFVTVEKEGGRETDVALWRDGKFDIDAQVIAYMDIEKPNPYILDTLPEGYILPSSSAKAAAIRDGKKIPEPVLCRIGRCETVLGIDYVEVWVDGKRLEAPCCMVVDKRGRPLSPGQKRKF